jgi:hypothetical protein
MKYKSTKTPEKYKCDECKAVGVKLWRRYQTVLDHQSLKCAECACMDQGKENTVGTDGFIYGEFGPTDTIGWLVPAIPTEDESTYWGYTSVPPDGVTWWRTLPTKAESVDKAGYWASVLNWFARDK